MNIFYLDTDVVKCAEYHNDKHTVKMILEYAQLLSTAHRLIDGNLNTDVKLIFKKNLYLLPGESYEVTYKPNKAGVLKPKINIVNGRCYKSTHVNHPSAKWVRKSKENYDWLFGLFVALLNEYTYRYKKIHKTSKYMDFLSNTPRGIKSVGFTEPTPAMLEEFKVGSNSLEMYRNYYRNGKTHLAEWKNREQPWWL
jgi:hypothetical protein